MDRTQQLKQEVISYWADRSADFAMQRKHELFSNKAERWNQEILPILPKDRDIHILDAGTGSGFFPILLTQAGYQNVTGIDLTPDMILEAEKLAADLDSPASFLVMDAENPAFADETFDVIITRNLTWTLPHPDAAYKSWFRLLKKGGVLLNFDGDYGAKEQHVDLPENHAHKKISDTLLSRHEQIMQQLPNTFLSRPASDVNWMKDAGFSELKIDFQLGNRIYQEIDEFYNPVQLFMLYAKK